MAGKIYEYRDIAKKLYNEEYKVKLEPYTHIVKAVMKANNVEEIPALLKISKTEIYQENSISQMMFCAAVTELLDPP